MALRLLVLGVTGHIGTHVVDLALARGHDVTALMAESAASLVAAMTTSRVKRLAIVSAAVLFPDPRLRFRFFRWLLREHARDLAAMEAVVRATDLDWTIARPPRLVNGTNESYRWRDDALPEGAWSMPFRVVAACLVDCAESAAHTRARIGLGAGARTADRARTEREASA